MTEQVADFVWIGLELSVTSTVAVLEPAVVYVLLVVFVLLEDELVVPLKLSVPLQV